MRLRPNDIGQQKKLLTVRRMILLGESLLILCALAGLYELAQWFTGRACFRAVRKRLDDADLPTPRELANRRRFMRNSGVRS